LESLKTALFTFGRFLFLSLFVQCEYIIGFGCGCDSAYSKFIFVWLVVMSSVCACTLCYSQIWVASICLFGDKNMRTIVPNVLHARISVELIHGCQQFEEVQGLSPRVESRYQNEAPFSNRRREGGFSRSRQLCCYHRHLLK
jgi:hypothetical protein